MTKTISKFSNTNENQINANSKLSPLSLRSVSAQSQLNLLKDGEWQPYVANIQLPATSHIIYKINCTKNVCFQNWKSKENPKMKMKTVNFPLKVAKRKSNYVVSSLFFPVCVWKHKALRHFGCFCLHSMWMCGSERKLLDVVDSTVRSSLLIHSLHFLRLLKHASSNCIGHLIIWKTSIHSSIRFSKISNHFISFISHPNWSLSCFTLQSRILSTSIDLIGTYAFEVLSFPLFSEACYNSALYGRQFICSIY